MNVAKITQTNWKIQKGLGENMKAVFFDLDDTLLWDSKCIEEAFSITCKEAEKQTNISAELIEKSVRNKARALYETYDVYPFTQMIGINPFEGLWGTFHDGTFEFPALEKIAPIYQEKAWTDGLLAIGVDSTELGKNLAQLFKESRENISFLYPETLTVLQKLKNAFRLALITNGAPTLQHHKLKKAQELTPFFEKTIISGDLGKGKPHHTVFEHVLAEMNLGKDEAIMIGDNLNTDIRGANAIGMKSIWINHHQKTAPDDNKPTYEVTSLQDILPLLLSE